MFCAGIPSLIPTAPGAVVLGLPIALLRVIEEAVDSLYIVEMANILSFRRAYEEQVHGEGVLKGL